MKATTIESARAVVQSLLHQELPCKNHDPKYKAVTFPDWPAGSYTIAFRCANCGITGFVHPDSFAAMQKEAQA